eukprot:NODE_972_length_709_cov_2.975758_g758_i0.p2 GENE.NODE_972_length_709_cov_2.975758_g758_i0~~NODE_972_length_709_cov_2.975758_g758_i0.p2  ORF type:complete len:65 (-),score=1.22 NODE_972_length_709_cov_2.975758_g758_i0:165-359(-)
MVFSQNSAKLFRGGRTLNSARPGQNSCSRDALAPKFCARAFSSHQNATRATRLWNFGAREIHSH